MADYMFDLQFDCHATAVRMSADNETDLDDKIQKLLDEMESHMREFWKNKDEALAMVEIMEFYTDNVVDLEEENPDEDEDEEEDEEEDKEENPDDDEGKEEDEDEEEEE